MTISARVAHLMVRWLAKKHKYIMMDAVIPEGKHLHSNPPKGRKKKVAK